MRTAIFAAALAMTAHPAAADTDDKTLHALAGTAIYAATGSVGACALAGVAKEAFDATGSGQVEAADVVATVLPCLLLHLISQGGRESGLHGHPVETQVNRADLMTWASARGWQ